MATFTFRQGHLPKLDLQVDRGTDFAAWKSQWYCYSSLSGLTDQSDEKQVHALTLCFSLETLTIVQNLGLSEDDRKKVSLTIAALKRYVDGHVNETSNVGISAGVFNSLASHSMTILCHYVSL